MYGVIWKFFQLDYYLVEKNCIFSNECLTVGDKGKPWFMYEAFQFIIKAQVEYLINLGVDAALKVFHSSVVTTFYNVGCAFKNTNGVIEQKSLVNKFGHLHKYTTIWQ